MAISTGSCHQMFTEKQLIRRVNEKFVPSLLSDAQRERIALISVRNCLPMQMVMKTVFKNIIIGDETWVYGYDVETKIQSSLWVGKWSPRPKKSTDESVIDQGDVGFIFKSETIVHHEFVPRGQTVNSCTRKFWRV